MSVFGQTKTNKLPFGVPEPPQLSAAWIPPPYQLDFFGSQSYLGVPFFHFMSNWETTGGASNFTKLGGGTAQIGDWVESWKNTYLSLGEGDAVVNPNGFFAPVLLNPTLVERTYSGKTYKGLEFTGTEYLQIDGASVSDPYSIPAPMFSTGGVPWAGNTGATFMFVIDSSEDVGADTYRSPVQSLIYSRQPNLQGTMGTVDIPVPWPNTEDLGIQYFRNQSPNPVITQPFQTEPAVGPQATMQGQAHFSTALTRSPVGGYGGSEYTLGDAGLEYGGGLDFKARWANPGFQVILLEYDNINQAKHVDIPGMGGDQSYGGPQVKIYGMSNPNNPPHGNMTLPWNGLDLTVPKITFTNPMLRDHTLFDKAHLFLGGVPAIRLEVSQLVGQRGNGFRGIIYEVLMLEGVLTPRDKSRLGKILQRKYGAPLGL